MRICQSNFTSWKKISNCNRSVELRYDIIICNFLQKDPCGMIKGHSFWNIIVFLAHICPFFCRSIGSISFFTDPSTFFVMIRRLLPRPNDNHNVNNNKNWAQFFFSSNEKTSKNINRSDKSLKDFRPKIFKLTRPHDGLGTKGKIIGKN